MTIDLIPPIYSLGTEIKRVVQEEIASREYVLSQGVRDLRKMVQLQPNDFTCIDDKATDYDDLRNCCLCKQTCLFTAIACECDRDKVTCLRHFSLMCKCPNQKKFLLGMATFSDYHVERILLWFSLFFTLYSLGLG